MPQLDSSSDTPSDPYAASKSDLDLSVQSKSKLPRFLDGVERISIVLLYSFFLSRMFGAYWQTGNIGNLLMLVTESILVGFVLCRKATNDLSLRFGDWFLAFAATSLPLLAVPQLGQSQWPVWNAVAVLLTFAGLVVQVLSKFTLGRRFGVVAANRGICIAGPYRLVRHPIYMGYLISHIGFCMLSPALWNLALFATLYALKIPRILAEERLLSQDAKYRDYQKIVRYRLVPGLF
ncbi:MAG: isoprenylcysteine carboxylmethyltransferase family protein [Planctomycetota bacterium]|nr:isoprenylcysteine carboxylmethyltransferase family protein [Planctomycetota bacterium]